LWEVEVGSGVGSVGAVIERSCCGKEDALSSSRQEEEEQKVTGRDWEEEEELFWYSECPECPVGVVIYF